MGNRKEPSEIRRFWKGILEKMNCTGGNSRLKMGQERELSFRESGQ